LKHEQLLPRVQSSPLEGEDGASRISAMRQKGGISKPNAIGDFGSDVGDGLQHRADPPPGSPRYAS
jgi:hypothetical protein